MRFLRFAVIVVALCGRNLRHVLGTEKEYSLLMSLTATSRGNTYRYDADVALHYTFPLFGWHDSTFDAGRSTRGRERLHSFLTKPLTYLERIRQLLLNQESELSVRYDCFLGQVNFHCFITQYRDAALIMKATLSCGIQATLRDHGACVPGSVFAWGDGKRLLGLLTDNDIAKPETEAFPDLFYDLSVIQHDLFRNSNPEELKVIAYVNSEKNTITCQVKSGLEVRFRIKCEMTGSIPAFDDGRMKYLESSGSKSVRYRTVEAHATIKLNLTVATVAKCTVESSLGWVAVFELTWIPRMGTIGGRGLPMSLKRQAGPGSGYTVPDIKVYESSLYKETPYVHGSYKRYLGLSLGDFISTVVLSVLFVLFVGLIVVVWRRNVTINVFPCLDCGRRPSSFSSASTDPHRKTTLKANTVATSKIGCEIPLNKRP